MCTSRFIIIISSSSNFFLLFYFSFLVVWRFGFWYLYGTSFDSISPQHARIPIQLLDAL